MRASPTPTGTHALRRGADMATVRDTLAHESMATTSRYLHARPEKSSRRLPRALMVDRLHLTFIDGVGVCGWEQCRELRVLSPLAEA
jgi:hypothetical protein